MVHIISRRRFFRKGLAGISLAATAPHFLDLSSSAFAGEPRDDRILVVLQLSGGNDGLSTVVPHTNADYYRHRRATAIASKDVLKLNGELGLHPELKQTHSLFHDGRLAIVQGVSYPNPNRSHFKSMDIWHTGSEKGRGLDTGWLGRAIDSQCPKADNPNRCVNIGQELPYALEAKVNKAVSFPTVQSYRWTGRAGDEKTFDELNEPVEKTDTDTDTDMDKVDWLHRVAVDARRSSAEIRAAAAGYRAKARYPNGRLAADLRTVAGLIAGGVQTRVYYVSFGGFDTHIGQQNRYANLVRQLDPALGAFYADLKAQGLSKKVLLVSFSEFGRRVKENASQGTDHGVAGPMFLLGDSVKGGVYEKHPSLTDLDNGDLKMRMDFRRVYASVLEDWMGIGAARILDGRFPKLPLLA